MIYIPTLTYKLRENIEEEYENVLYSPSKIKPYIYIAKNITIWDNHTFYYLKRYYKPNKQEKAFEHYLWFIDFIKTNYKEGVALITPDVDWMNEKYSKQIEELWLEKCYNYPQLYMPNSWKTSTDKLNIVGHVLRYGQDEKLAHSKWTHCLGFKGKNIKSELVTYDKYKEE